MNTHRPVPRPVGWFNPWNKTHGYQQVAKQFEGTSGTIPLYGAAAIEGLTAEVERLKAAGKQAIDAGETIIATLTAERDAARTELAQAREALKQVETVMTMTAPRNNTADYLAALAAARSALTPHEQEN